MVCNHRRWFLPEPGQGGRPFFQLPADARKITQLTVCASAWAATGYPVTWDVIGRILSHAMTVLCTRCQDGRGDEKHMVFECSALQHIRDEYPALFAGDHTMRSFMNQADQRSIIHFISECLDCSNHMVGAV